VSFRVKPSQKSVKLASFGSVCINVFISSPFSLCSEGYKFLLIAHMQHARPHRQNAAYGVDRPDNVSFPNGQTVNYDWQGETGDFRLKEIENLGASNTALSKFNYVTDAVSRITQWKQQRGTSATERYDLGYDPVDQLTSAVLKTDSTSAILKQNYYKYDLAGNRTSEQIDSAVKTATFNNLNQMTATSTGGQTRFKGTLNEPGAATVAGQTAWMTSGTNFQADVNLTTGTNTVAVVASDANSNTRTNSYRVVIPSGGSTTVTSDANGNMLSDGTNTYSWDAKSRLVRTTYSGGASTEYSYDAFGRRIKIVEKDSGGTVTSTKQFVFDGMEEAEQRDGSNAVTKRYFADGWRDVAASASYFYTKDHLGSIREVTDGSGALVSRYDYDSYGRTTKVSGSVDSDMLYTGHYYDLSSGLYLSMYRAYSPNLARWLSRDPIGESGGINLYGYVANNPINWVDPDGLSSESPSGGQKNPTPITPGISQSLTRQGVPARNLAIPQMAPFRNFLGELLAKGKIDKNNDSIVNANKVGKPGDAASDFARMCKLSGATTEPKQTDKGPITFARFPDGGTASLRDFSKSKEPCIPTIQITPPSGPKIRLRYDQ